jgi:hypothetical protein
MYYLEISNVGAACGKMPFEPMERILLYSWARYSPGDCWLYLMSNGHVKLDDDDRHRESHFVEHLSTVNTGSDVLSILENKKKELQQKNYSNEEIKAIEETGRRTLNVAVGSNSERETIALVKARSGNNKMYYYNLNFRWCIGGRHDADKDGVIYEIKSRMSRKNVRKNEYDLYQLMGYLLAMNASKGKIIQRFEGEVYQSDVETDEEWGIIDLDVMIEHKNEMLHKLRIFFELLEDTIKRGTLAEDVAQRALGKDVVCGYVDGNIVNRNPRYLKLFNHF